MKDYGLLKRQLVRFIRSYTNEDKTLEAYLKDNAENVLLGIFEDEERKA